MRGWVVAGMLFVGVFVIFDLLVMAVITSEGCPECRKSKELERRVKASREVN